MSFIPILEAGMEAAAAVGPEIAEAAAATATAFERAGPFAQSAAIGYASAVAGMFETPGKAAKKLRRMIRDGFKPKRLLEDFENSFGPAQKKQKTAGGSGKMAPKRPAKRSGRRPKPRKKTAKRSIKRRTSTKKKTKAKKKSRSLKKIVVNKQQPHGQAERDDVLYMGFQHHGGRTEILEVVCDALLRKYLGTVGVGIDNPDVEANVVSSSPGVSRAQLFYRSINYDAGTAGADVAGTVIDFETISYQAAVVAMATEVKTKARLGQLPYQISWKNASDQTIKKDRRFGDTIVNPTCTSVVKLRNITPNDGDNSTDRFALDTNPIQGKMYKFSGDIPVVKDSIMNPESGSAAGTADEIRTGWAKWMDAFKAKGVCGTNINTSVDPQLQTDQIMSSPPMGSKVFKNCTSTKSIALSAGGKAAMTLKYSYYGPFSRFIHQIVGNGNTDFSKVGACTWVGFEQVYSSKGSIGTPHDKVRVEYDTHSTLRCGVQLKPQEKSPATVDAGLINF